MEKTEPTFVPEWLKSSGGLSTTSHQFMSLHLDDQGVKKSVRNKSLDNGLGRSSVLNRTTSSYFRRASSNSNGSASYSSFNRNNRRDHRDLAKDIDEFRNKEKLDSRRFRDYSDPLGNVFPSRFEKDGLRRSHSSVSESWPKKVVSDFERDKSSRNNGSVSSVKRSFERDFPSLGADEKQVDSDVGRVPSPGLSSAIQSLPTGSSAVIGGDGWTSALAEVPVIVGSNGNGNGTSVAQTVQPSLTSVTTGMTGGRNMAETLAQGPPRTQTTPQVDVGTQRLEELAVKQSRQLIPMTPSLPKALAMNSSDKPKLKVAQSQLQSSHLVNLPHTPRSISIKPDLIKTSNVGKLLVLKPSRERNGISPTAKETLSPTAAGTKLPNSPLSVPSSVVIPSKPIVATLEKRPSPQALSRSNFFKLMRKKSMTSNSSVAPETVSSGSSSEPAFSSVVPDGGSSDLLVNGSSETNKVDLMTCNGDPSMRSTNNGSSGPDVIRCSEEEEARFLRSLGWEETAEEEEEGLTEEEISSFLENYQNMKPTLKFLKVPKPLMPMGEISSNSKMDS